MSGETILKSSIFGGYKKEEVNQYVDFVVEENDKRMKELQERITYLTRENSQLKNQLDTQKEIKPEISDKSDKSKYHDTHESRQTAQFALADLNGSKNQEKLPVRQQMELPEGIYIVSKEQGMVSLPEPTPVYRTKGKNTISDTMSGIKEDKLSESQEEPSTFHENVAPEVAEQIEKNGIVETGSKEKSTNTINVKGAETAVGARKISKDEFVPMQQNETSGEYSNKQYAHEAGLPSPESCLPEDVTETQKELLYVKALLEKERHEKQVLAAKLEFSNDLLIQLYKK